MQMQPEDTRERLPFDSLRWKSLFEMGDEVQGEWRVRFGREHVVVWLILLSLTFPARSSSPL